MEPVYVAMPVTRYAWRCSCGATGLDATPGDSSLSYGLHVAKAHPEHTAPTEDES